MIPKYILAKDSEQNGILIIIRLETEVLTTRESKWIDSTSDTIESEFLKHDVLQVLSVSWKTSYSSPSFAAVLKAALNSRLSNYSMCNGWQAWCKYTS
jgi:hypothetical protein